MTYYSNPQQGYEFSNINTSAQQQYAVPPGTAIQWMPRPSPIPGCPPGLEYLLQLDSVNVQELASLVEALTGWETNNKYIIRDRLGYQAYYAAEETDTCMRICCGPQRGFNIYIIDNLNSTIAKISREFKCCAGCGWCAGCCNGCAHEVVVEAPPGQIIGYVRQRGSSWKARYEVLDENHSPVLKIEGPCCVFDGPCCPCENEFKLLTLDGQNQIGKICKEYAGFINEMFTKADKFSISFPMDLAVKTKATLLGALFLIDFMFFERNTNNNRNQYYSN